MTNQEKIDLINDDLYNCYIESSQDYRCSLVYAYDNGYFLHAASLWMSTGAMSEEVEKLVQGVQIDHEEEMKEINQLCDAAFIYICKDCNHHEFLEEDEGEEVNCPSCLKTCKFEK